MIIQFLFFIFDEYSGYPLDICSALYWKWKKIWKKFGWHSIQLLLLWSRLQCKHMTFEWSLNKSFLIWEWPQLPFEWIALNHSNLLGFFCKFLVCNDTIKRKTWQANGRRKFLKSINGEFLPQLCHNSSAVPFYWIQS